MSKSRSLSQRESGASGGGMESAQPAPTGILPPSLARSGANNETVELLTAAFATFYPGVQDIGELDKFERTTWLRIREGLLQGNKAAIEALKGLVEAVNKQVSAEAEDLSQRRAAELKDKSAKRKRKNQTHAQRVDETRKQHEVDLKKKTQELEIRLERHKQQSQQSRERHQNQVLKEQLLMAMTAVSFISLTICVVIASLTGHLMAYGGGAVFSLLSAGGTLRLFVLNKDQSDQADGDDTDQE